MHLEKWTVPHSINFLLYTGSALDFKLCVKNIQIEIQFSWILYQLILVVLFVKLNFELPCCTWTILFLKKMLQQYNRRCLRCHSSHFVQHELEIQKGLLRMKKLHDFLVFVSCCQCCNYISWWDQSFIFHLMHGT